MTGVNYNTAAVIDADGKFLEENEERERKREKQLSKSRFFVSHSWSMMDTEYQRQGVN